MKLFSILFFVLIIGCFNQVGKQQKIDNMNPTLSIIANSHSTPDSLLKALSNLQNEKETPEFWTDIANDKLFNEDHRRRAVFMLFKRHIQKDISLKKMAILLGMPNWLQYENISILQALGGEIPVKFNFDDTIFVIQVFPNLPDGRWENWAIYLRIEGKISSKDFYEIISTGGEKGEEELKERKLLEFGLSPDTPEQKH